VNGDPALAGSEGVYHLPVRGTAGITSNSWDLREVPAKMRSVSRKAVDLFFMAVGF
jgi:hypothetical protein